MTAGAPWSVKGIHPKAREIAKDHARRSGMTLGEWLNRVILDDEEGEAPVRPRLVAQPGEGGAELARVAAALERLTDRVEASETRTGLAVTGVEHAVREALARIEATERENLAFVARVDGVGGEQAKLAERLRQMEAEAAGPRSSEALRAIEQAVASTAAQVYEIEARLTRERPDPAALAEEVLARAGQRLATAEGHTSDALESLRVSLAALDGRLGALESDRGREEARLEDLARRMSEQVESARIQFAERLKHADAGRVEQRFAELAQELEAAERRSTQAIQEMGRQVLGMADAVNRRLQVSESRSAEAIALAGGEMARVAEALEARLGAAESAQAEQVARLSEELERISDKLSDRLLVAERRAADAIDDVGQQVARVTERMAESHSRTAQELAETIRESEGRTARLLEETRARLEQRIGDGPLPAAPPQPSTAAFGPELFSRAEELDEEEEDLDLLDLARSVPRLTETPEFAPIPEPEDDLFDLDQPEPPAGAEVGPELSTREVIEQARAAARTVAPEPAPTPAMAARSWSSSGFFGLRPRRGPNSTLQTAIMVAGGAAFLSVGAAGVVLMQRQPGGAPAAAIADSQPARAAVALAAPAESTPATPPVADDALAAAFAGAARELEAGQPGALDKLKAVAEAGHPPAELYLGKLYESGGHGVQRDLAKARAWTAKAAEAADAAAMHNLALFEFRGEGGRQDLAEAARWFKAAAERGVVDSQYNLGLLYQSGSGVPRDAAQAYAWFALAASSGDAQARANALKLKDQLTPAQRADGEKLVAAYQARRGSGDAAGGIDLATVQRVLNRLGYLGHAAGEPETRTALADYQRDHGLPATGELDGRTAQRLAAFR
jgi:localization factor PodJL